MRTTIWTRTLKSRAWLFKSGQIHVMLMRNKYIIVAVILAVIVGIAIAMTPSMVADNVRVSIRTHDGSTTYSINGRDYGTDKTQAVSGLARFTKFSSGPFEIMVDSNTTFVAFATFLGKMNEACPKAKWYATYKVGPKDVSVLYDAKIHPEPHVVWSIVYDIEEPEHNKNLEPISGSQ